ASALIGESIVLQVGLANSRGPNVAAQEIFGVVLTCEGCTATPGAVKIASGKTYAESQIRINAASARIDAAIKGGLRPAVANAFGCSRASSVAIAAEQDRSTGGADGVTPIPFRFAFHDSTGQRATDGRRKYVAPKLSGVGQRVSLDSS